MAMRLTPSAPGLRSRLTQSLKACARILKFLNVYVSPMTALHPSVPNLISLFASCGISPTLSLFVLIQMIFLNVLGHRPRYPVADFFALLQTLPDIRGRHVDARHDNMMTWEA